MLINQQVAGGDYAEGDAADGDRAAASALGIGPRRRGRPPRPRCVAALPPVTVFKPAGIPARALRSVALGVDELEAMRLVDAQGLSQESAAGVMGISRQTVGRLLETGRRTTVRALAEGLAIDIGGGTFCLGPAGGDTCPRGRAGLGHAGPGYARPGRGRCCQRTTRETHTDD